MCSNRLLFFTFWQYFNQDNSNRYRQSDRNESSSSRGGHSGPRRFDSGSGNGGGRGPSSAGGRSIGRSYDGKMRGGGGDMITSAVEDSNMEQNTRTAAKPAAAAEGAQEEAAPPEEAATATRLVPASGVDMPAYHQIVFFA
jgi:hypothetical protein